MTIPAHAELGIAFFQGKTLQYKVTEFDNIFSDWDKEWCPCFGRGYEWRIKPEPKVTRYLAYEDMGGWIYFRKENNLPPTNGYKRIPALDKEVVEEE